MIFKWGIVTELGLSVIFITCFYTYLHFNTYISVKNEIYDERKIQVQNTGSKWRALYS